jgi:general secretion pathway protein L
MPLTARFHQWIAILASLLSDWIEEWHARDCVLVERDNGQFILRGSRPTGGDFSINLPIGQRLANNIDAQLRNRPIVYALQRDKFVTRTLTVPAQAQAFLPGIVRNQIERLSPWPLAQTIYGFSSMPQTNASGNLSLCVFIASRAAIDASVSELATCGLSCDQITARNESSHVVLYKRGSDQKGTLIPRLPKLIAGALAILLVSSMALSAIAIMSLNGLSNEIGDVSIRISTLEHSATSRHGPHHLSGLSPAQMAWAAKKNSPSAVLLLDALAASLPDTAYLTELKLHDASVRISGLAADAPSLVEALEKSKRFSAVHFFAPTTREREADRYRFFIEARVDNRLLLGD